MQPKLALLLLALLLAGCPAAGGGGKPAPVPAAASVDPTEQSYVSPPLPKAWVVLKDAFGGKHRVEVEVAATGPARQRGMMWRTSLAEGKGMLFLFPAEEQLSFWMRNTLIPLDMIFISRDYRVVGIVSMAEPQTLTSRGVLAPSQYVLEVPGGWSDKVGLKVGARAEFSGTSMIEIRP